MADFLEFLLSVIAVAIYGVDDGPGSRLRRGAFRGAVLSLTAGTGIIAFGVAGPDAGPGTHVLVVTWAGAMLMLLMAEFELGSRVLATAALVASAVIVWALVSRSPLR